MLRKFFKLLAGFSVVGGICTLITILLNWLFISKWGMSLFWSYFTVYLGTIMLSYYLNSRMVFKSEKSVTNLLMYYGVYGSGMLFGAVVLTVYKRYIPLPGHILTYLVIPATTGWNFVMSSMVFKADKIKAFINSFRNASAPE